MSGGGTTTGEPAQPAAPPSADEQDKHRLTTLSGLAALSLDALSSVAYGPEAIVIVLMAAGTAGLNYTLPVTLAIVILLGVLVISYRQVIAAFPGGGGAYAVARTHLSRGASLVAAGSLIVDYILNAAVGVSAGVAALTSAFPSLYGATVPICLVVLALITAVNLWGVGESARLFIVPTLAFIAAIAAVIIAGLIRSHPVVAPHTALPHTVEAVGVLLLLRAFASGCSALTGVEAIANAVPQFRRPRVRHAQHTELWLGVTLGVMLIGLAVLIKKFHVTSSPNETVLAQLAAAGLGKGAAFYFVQLITTVLLALAANTSFGGLPVLASLLARDNYLPHLFFLRADRQVHRYGVVVLAIAAALLLVASGGNTQRLVPLFAIGVFVGFTLSQAGMVRHWRADRRQGWAGRAAINGLGALLTLAALAVELISKFTEGAWLIVLIVPLLVLMFSRVHATYGRIGSLLQIGTLPPHPAGRSALVVVPVGGISRLTEEGISAALSLGDEVIAVTVSYTDEDGQADDGAGTAGAGTAGTGAAGAGAAGAGAADAGAAGAGAAGAGAAGAGAVGAGAVGAGAVGAGTTGAGSIGQTGAAQTGDAGEQRIPDDPSQALHDLWDRWDPGVPLVTLHAKHRSLGPPIVGYLRDLEAQDRFHRIVVLIPEVQPARPWQQILHNQRGFVLDRAIRKGTENVVICRLRFQRSTWSAPDP